MADSRMYPEGRGQTVTRWILGTEVIFGMVKKLRARVTIAQLNASGGLNLLPALPGVRWRLFDVNQVAIGGNAATATSVNVTGTVAGVASELVVTAIAALTRSALVRAGAANSVILADGASFTQMDANTAILTKTVGAALATCTHIDTFLEYVADAA